MSCSLSHVFPILIYLHSKTYGNQWPLTIQTDTHASIRDRAIFPLFWRFAQKRIRSYYILFFLIAEKITVKVFFSFFERYRFYVFGSLTAFLQSKSIQCQSRSCVIIDSSAAIDFSTSGTCAPGVLNLIDFYLCCVSLEIWSCESRQEKRLGVRVKIKKFPKRVTASAGEEMAGTTPRGGPWRHNSCFATLHDLPVFQPSPGAPKDKALKRVSFQKKKNGRKKQENADVTCRDQSPLSPPLSNQTLSFLRLFYPHSPSSSHPFWRGPRARVCLW